MNIPNDEITEVLLEVPSGHTHLRTRLLLRDGSELVFQEATIANIVGAYTAIRTHPTRASVRLRGRVVTGGKNGFAEYQLLEDEGDD